MSSETLSAHRSSCRIHLFHHFLTVSSRQLFLGGDQFNTFFSNLPSNIRVSYFVFISFAVVCSNHYFTLYVVDNLICCIFAYGSCQKSVSVAPSTIPLAILHNSIIRYMHCCTADRSFVNFLRCVLIRHTVFY